MHVLPLSKLAGTAEDNIAALEVARAISGNTGVVAIAALIVVCTFGALNGVVITYPRLYYRMAQESFFLKAFHLFSCYPKCIDDCGRENSISQ